MEPSTVESVMMHSFTPRRRAACRRCIRRVALAAVAAPAAFGGTTLLAASTARADGDGTPTAASPASDSSVTLGEGPTLTLDPTAPQATALPGGMTPAFGQIPLNTQDLRFAFHGLLTAPLNAGINGRQAFQNGAAPNARPGQSAIVLHAPPVVPDDLETFSHTGVVPMTYAQLSFSEGNGVVAMHVSILARQVNVSESFLDTASQAGITDAFLSYVPDLGSHVKMGILVGGFTSRYGATGEYDEGRYGTPLIARINGAGELVSARFPLGSFALQLEQGLQGQTNTANASITPDVWNNFANPEEGATFVNHLHAGFAYENALTVGGHFINAQSHDDRATGTLAVDGSVSILAADLGLNMRRFGRLYLAFASTKATHARTVSRILQVLNTPGGPGLEKDYLGPESAGGDGTGVLDTFGGQYDLSLGRLVSYPAQFVGDGPDIVLSLFGMVTHVSSRVAPTGGVYGNGILKAKYGAEATYGVLPWLAVSARFDQVMPNTDDSRYSFSVLSPRAIFRTNWLATDQLVLQYSHWFDGSRTTVREGSPPIDDPAITSDGDMLSLSASMWW